MDSSDLFDPSEQMEPSSAADDSEPLTNDSLFSMGQSGMDSIGEEDETLTETERAEGAEDDDEEYVTPAQLVAEMRTAWMNERAAPVILPNRFDIIELLQEQLQSMEDSLSHPRNRDKTSTSIHQLEHARCSYLLNDYMRTRLRKIEDNPRAALKEHMEREQRGGNPSTLSPSEFAFATRYATAESRYFSAAFLSHLPSALSLQKIPVPRTSVQHQRCFAMVTSDGVEDVAVSDLVDPTQEDLVSMPRDTIHCIPFESIREHLESDKILLL